MEVFFEKEKLDTGSLSGEVLLGFYGTLAQEESVSISGNMRWSYERRMRSGKFITTTAPLGYRLTAGKLIIKESEAEIVRFIFDSYTEGKGVPSIAAMLAKKGVATVTGNEKWSVSTIFKMLGNEKYVGDALLQKTFTTDNFPYTQKRNTGERDQHYISTLNMSNEMVFTVLSAFAQAESESISENVKFGKRHSFKNGKIPFQYGKILGYERGEDGKPKIVPEQAETVARIYALYIAGASIAQIKRNLEEAGIPSASGKPEWSQSVINYILKNEKYIGDALLQKTYVVNCISKEVRKNNGDVPQYYVHNSHDAIIPRDVFYRVQEEMARRNAKRRVAEKNVITERGKYSSKYALSELLQCGDCGTRYRRVTWARKGKIKIVWRCISRLEYGTKTCKDSPSIEESVLHEAIRKAIGRMIALKDDMLADFAGMIQDAVDHPNNTFDRIATEKQIEELDRRVRDIAAVLAKPGSSMDGFSQIKDLTDQIGTLRELCKQDDERKAAAAQMSNRMKGLLKELETDTPDVDRYDDATVRRIVEKVTVVSKSKLLVTFMGGYEIEQEIPG